MSNKWLQSSKVKVSLVHDCSEMSKSDHGEIKGMKRIPISKAMLARIIISYNSEENLVVSSRWKAKKWPKDLAFCR